MDFITKERFTKRTDLKCKSTSQSAGGIARVKSTKLRAFDVKAIKTIAHLRVMHSKLCVRIAAYPHSVSAKLVSFEVGTDKRAPIRTTEAPRIYNSLLGYIIKLADFPTCRNYTPLIYLLFEPSNVLPQQSLLEQCCRERQGLGVWPCRSSHSNTTCARTTRSGVLVYL